MTSLLYGMHDREGRHIVPPGGWCLDTVALSENPPPTNYVALRGDINWMVRLNWGYGSTGTIPLPDRYQEFAVACAKYVALSPGANTWIIGNEPNHEQERPDGVYISPEQYARCFKMCRDAIKQAYSLARVIPAPPAPYHANPVDWLMYWREMLDRIAGTGGCDGLAIHAYVRTSDPASVHSVEKMGPPLQDQFSSFFTYRDALAAVPKSLGHLPVYVTEFNELLPDGWDNRNTGVVQKAYEEVNWWNQRADTQKIHCLILYRWPKHDKWHIEGKEGVVQDFQAAVAQGYTSPGTQAPTHTVNLPNVQVAAPVTREWDSRLDARGVKVESPPNAQWVVTSARWLDEQESGGRHHIYVSALDENGHRLRGVPLKVTWPSGEHRIVTEAKLGEPYMANYPMSASRNEFSIQVDDGTPSEKVVGIGMGADTPGGFNAGIHTSTTLNFRRTAITAPAPLRPVPTLLAPVKDAAARISQKFGENPAAYAKFGFAGHTGLDFAVPEGTPVSAVAAGTVQEARNDPVGYGEYIKLRHPWGESVYGHLRVRNVAVDDAVQAGQVIGLSGNTGNSTGPHLHLGIRVNPYVRGAPFDGYSDPERYLNLPKPAPEPTGNILAMLKAEAVKQALDWRLVASLVQAESSFNPKAESKAGAIGLMQIMRPTFDEWAPRVGVNDIWNPAHNLAVGCAYLAWLIRYFKGNEYKALAAYNWGVGNVDRNPELMPAATKAYANKVLFGRDLLKVVGT